MRSFGRCVSASKGRARPKGKGKAKMAVLGAAMRKLLHIVLGVLKSGKPFDPNIMTAPAGT